MISKQVTVGIPTGLEARTVAVVVQIASKYDCDIHFELDTKKVNAKSIMGMMTLGINAGESVTVCASGSDEAQAIDDLEKYLENK